MPFSQATLPVLHALLIDSDERVIASAIHALAHHSRAAVTNARRLAFNRLSPS
jgi:hypothetical protein